MNDIGFLFVPPHVMAREDLSVQEKVVYGRIVGLTEKHGYCFATNDWIGKQIGMSAQQISRNISSLVKKGFLNLEMERVKKSQRTGQIGEKYGTIRKIFAYLQADSDNGIIKNDVPPYIKNDEYREEKEYRDNTRMFLEEAVASPNPTTPLGDYLQMKREREEKKRTKSPYRSSPPRDSIALSRAEGLEISLRDNVPPDVMVTLAEKYQITVDQVEECKTDYINWIMGSSYDKKTWGRDMLIMVDKFCSHKAVKNKTEKPKDLYEELDLMYQAQEARKKKQ